MVSLFNKNKIAIIPTIWVLIYFAVIPMQLTNFVLCVGSDGHVSFEYAINGSCTDIVSHDTVNSPQTESLVNESEEDHCGECIDFPVFTSLNSQPVITQFDTSLPYQDTIYSFDSSITERILPAIPVIPISSIPPLIDPTLFTLQTVTLLI